MKTIIFDGKPVTIASPKEFDSGRRGDRRSYNDCMAMRTAWLAGETQESIAKRFGISAAWVSKLIQSVTPRKNPPKL